MKIWILKSTNKVSVSLMRQEMCLTGAKNIGVNEAHLFLFFLFQIFMKPDFALEDSITFNAVLPWSHFSTAGGKGNRDAASSKLLQEKVQL